eukprot:TRINITY_DN22059_c0_g1_i1.p1 TRINITY_DN22059_c0_g1~~TRINITY_DN22059_c0_g1_i1.p1  ORF type:complete len:304 (-),score=15.01 TRINITY_DN22059_c0_g1_i1:113-922(-)
MVLIPQPFFAEYTIHSAEFQVLNITLHKHNAYTRGTAQMYNEITYKIVLQRYPHYQLLNFILPMLAITLLTIATMWMNNATPGPRVNSGTKLLLCVVSIIFITARGRPPINGDIWMDRFQSHCLALAMSAVLETLFIDHMTKSLVLLRYLPSPAKMDSMLRSAICCLAMHTLVVDGLSIDAGVTGILAGLTGNATGMLLSFVYFLSAALMVSSVWALLWFICPSELRAKMIGKSEDGDNHGYDQMMRDERVPYLGIYSTPRGRLELSNL